MSIDKAVLEKHINQLLVGINNQVNTIQSANNSSKHVAHFTVGIMEGRIVRMCAELGLDISEVLNNVPKLDN